MEETILTPEQVAQILQMHPFTVLKFIKQGKLKASKLGRVYRIRRSDVDVFLDEQAKESEAAMENRKRKKNEAKPAIEAPVEKVPNIKIREIPNEEVTAKFDTAPLQEEKSTTMQITPPEEKGDTERAEKSNFDHYIIEFKTET